MGALRRTCRHDAVFSDDEAAGGSAPVLGKEVRDEEIRAGGRYLLNMAASNKRLQ
jgi:hypothetical protein